MSNIKIAEKLISDLDKMGVSNRFTKSIKFIVTKNGFISIKNIKHLNNMIYLKRKKEIEMMHNMFTLKTKDRL